MEVTEGGVLMFPSLWDRIRLMLGLGMRCPECKAKPLKAHKQGCSISKWDGGIWA